VAGATLRVAIAAGSTNLTPVNVPAGLLVATNRAHTERADLDRSLNFELPPAWRTGTNVQLAFQRTNGTVADVSKGAVKDGAVLVSFPTVPAIQVKWLLTRWTGTDGVAHSPAVNRADELTARLLAIYPVTWRQAACWRIRRVISKTSRPMNWGTTLVSTTPCANERQRHGGRLRRRS
jgi:hypothetical protein